MDDPFDFKGREKSVNNLRVMETTSAGNYCIECNPIMLPSVSIASAINPYCPIENLSRTNLPPAAATRAASLAQSAHMK